MAGRIILDDGNRILDTNGDPLSGALVRAVEAGTSTPATLYTTNTLGTAHPNPVVADSAGYIGQLWASDSASFDIRVYAADDVAFATPLREFLSVITGEAAFGDAVLGYATTWLLELAGNGASDLDDAYLAEEGREGMFVFNASDLSALVALDPRGGIYLPTQADPTGASGAWVRRFDGELNVKWFGAKGDNNGTSGNGTDDSAAFKSCIAVLNALAVTFDEWKGNCPAIYVPRSQGSYRIVDADLFGTLNANSIVVRGDGCGVPRRNGASQIIFDPASSSAVLFDNVGQFGFSLFSNLGFRSVNGGKFMNLSDGGGVTQAIKFEDVHIHDFSEVMEAEDNSVNCSEIDFYRCKIGGFSSVGFKLGNEQAVNWRFFGTDIEVFSGTIFEFLEGAHVTFFGGSIVPTEDTAKIISVPSGARVNNFGRGNMPHMIFNGVRLELRGASRLIDKVSENADFRVVWNDCTMGGGNISDDGVDNTVSTADPAIYWRGSGRLWFNRCQNLIKYAFDTSTNLSAITNRFVFTSQDSALPANLLDESTFAFTGSADATDRLPLFRISGSGETSLDGEYTVGGGNYAGQQSVLPQPRAVSFSSSGGDMEIGVANAGARQQLLKLPPVVVRAIEVRPIPLAGYGTGNTSTVTVKTSDGLSTLATLTWDADAPVNAREIVYLNQRMTAADDELLFEFTTTYSGSANYFWRGHLFVHY